MLLLPGLGREFIVGLKESEWERDRVSEERRKSFVGYSFFFSYIFSIYLFLHIFDFFLHIFHILYLLHQGIPECNVSRRGEWRGCTRKP